MKILSLIILTCLSNNVLSQLLKQTEAIYNKEVVYCYTVEHIRQNNVKSENKMYLVCYGKPWAVDSLVQVKVNWAYNSKAIFDKTVGTGVIENSKRIWMHPPRQDEYSILEYSPFPYVKYPIVINNKWNWKLSLGKYWENKELGVLADDDMQYEYTIDCELELAVDFKQEKVKCHKIIANSINPKFTSSLVSYFNHHYGFIELHYTNIDGSKMKFKLIDVSSLNKLRYLNTYLAY